MIPCQEMTQTFSPAEGLLLPPAHDEWNTAYTLAPALPNIMEVSGTAVRTAVLR